MFYVLRFYWASNIIHNIFYIEINFIQRESLTVAITICTNSIEKVTIFCLPGGYFFLVFICLLKIHIYIHYKVKNQINRIYANAMSLNSIANDGIYYILYTCTGAFEKELETRNGSCFFWVLLRINHVIFFLHIYMKSPVNDPFTNNKSYMYNLNQIHMLNIYFSMCAEVYNVHCICNFCDRESVEDESMNSRFYA